jgi:YfiH family protein
MPERLLNLLLFREKITYLQYPNLFINPQIVHGVFTRHGGVSDPPYNSLNISYMVGDAPENVTGNLKTIKETIGTDHLICMNQSHGDGILVLRKGLYRSSRKIPSADAAITNMSHLALMVKLADCQGIIIFDPKRNVLAVIHCGWRGNVQNILKGVVIRMKNSFGCSESHLLAAISPSLGPCCAEFISHREIFPQTFKRFMVRENYFDLWAISRWQLVGAGLQEENIEIAGICNRCRSDLFYSYRGEGQTGRFGIVAMLN